MLKGPVFTQAVRGPFDGQVLNVINPRPGDTITVEGLGEKAKYHVTGRMTPDCYWEALYVDPEEAAIWRGLQESQPEGEPVTSLTLRSVPNQVCVGGDDGSIDFHRGALIQKILGHLPSSPLTSTPDHANGWTHEREQVRVCFVPTRSCGDYEAKALQTHRCATASRSVAGLDSDGEVCYAGGLGVFEGGWRSRMRSEKGRMSGDRRARPAHDSRGCGPTHTDDQGLHLPAGEGQRHTSHHDGPVRPLQTREHPTVVQGERTTSEEAFA